MSEWISVEERLPEKKQDVLMYFNSGIWRLAGGTMKTNTSRFGVLIQTTGFIRTATIYQPTGCPSQKARRRDSP